MGAFTTSDKLQVAVLLLSLVPFSATIFFGYESGNPTIVVVSTGLAIAVAGFALAWGTESLQFVVSQVLALAVLAIAQVVPEYSVEVVLAFRGASDPGLLGYATAAMTGANRLLLGLGWPVVYTLSYFTSKRSTGRGGDLILERQQGVEIVFLGLATLYSFVVVLRGNLGPVDAAVLLSIFIAYLYLAKRLPPHDPSRTSELEGPSLAVSKLTGARKGLAILALILVGSTVIVFASEPFVRNFLALAASLNLNQYLLIQWLTPILTELPEAGTVFYWANRAGKGSLALANLVSSKLNQWTLLVSTIPIVYTVALGNFQGIALSQLQVEELFLTASQSVYGFVCLMDLRLSSREAAQLFALFMVQLVLPPVRLEVSVLYLVLALLEIGVTRGRMPVVGEVVSLLKEHIH
jgi:cation:H+ antiporter